MFQTEQEVSLEVPWRVSADELTCFQPRPFQPSLMNQSEGLLEKDQQLHLYQLLLQNQSSEHIYTTLIGAEEHQNIHVLQEQVKSFP